MQCDIKLLFVFEGMIEKRRSCDGQGGGAQQPVLNVSELKKTGALMRGQNPLSMHYIHIIYENVSHGCTGQY